MEMGPYWSGSGKEVRSHWSGIRIGEGPNLFRDGIGAGPHWSEFALGERPHWSGVGLGAVVEDSSGIAGSDDRLSV